MSRITSNSSSTVVSRAVSKQKRSLILAAAVAGLGLFMGSAKAHQWTWTGSGGNNNWSNASNWQQNTWSPYDDPNRVDAVFYDDQGGSGDHIISMNAAGLHAATTDFGGGKTWRILGPNALDLRGGDLYNNGNDLRHQMKIASGTTVVFEANYTAQHGVGGFTVLDGGELRLLGTGSTSTATGDGVIYVSNGTLSFNNLSALGTAEVRLGVYDAPLSWQNNTAYNYTTTLRYLGTTDLSMDRIRGLNAISHANIDVVNAGATMTVTSVIGTLGTDAPMEWQYALVKKGAGTLALRPQVELAEEPGTFVAAGNTFAGHIRIDEGTLSILANNALGAGGNQVIIQNGATLRLDTAGGENFANLGGRRIEIGTGGGVIETAAGATLRIGNYSNYGYALTKKGEGNLLLNAQANMYPYGATAVEAGMLRLDNPNLAGNEAITVSGTGMLASGTAETIQSSINISGNGSFGSSGTDGTFNGTITLNGMGTLVFNSADRMQAGVDRSTTLSGTLNANGAAITVTGNDGNISKGLNVRGTLNGAGPITIKNGGVLMLPAGASLPTITMDTTPTGTLNYGPVLGTRSDSDAAFHSVALPQTGSFGLFVGPQTAGTTGRTLTLGSTINVSSGSTFSLGGDAGANYTLSVGTVSLGGPATINVKDATLAVTSNFNHGTNALTLKGNDSGYLNLNTSATSFNFTSLDLVGGNLKVGASKTLTVGTLGLNGGGIALESGAVFNHSTNLAANSGHSRIAGPGSLNMGAGARTMTVNDGASLTISAAMNTGPLTKAGAGTLTLSGANTIAGDIIISGGTLASRSPASLNNTSGNVFINGGTLALLSDQVTKVGTFANDGSYQVNGVAVMGSNLLHLTTGANDQRSSAFHNTQVNLDTFETSFVYRATPGSSGNMADGFAFVLHTDPTGTTAMGAGGGGLAYSGMTPAVAVAFDLYNGNGTTNPTRSGMWFSGQSASYDAMTGINLRSGNDILVQLSYDGSTLTQKMVDTVTGSEIVRAYNAPNLAGRLGSSTAYVGFTGATGGANANQFLSDFSYTGVANLNELTYGKNIFASGTAGIEVGARTVNLNALSLAGNTTFNVTGPVGNTAKFTGTSFTSVSPISFGGNASLDLGPINPSQNTVTQIGKTGTSRVTFGGVIKAESLVMGGGHFGGNSLELSSATPITYDGSAGAARVTGAVKLNGPSTFVVAQGAHPADLTIAGNLSGGSITKVGAGNLLLAGDNAITGVTVTGGTLAVASPNALGSGKLTLSDATLMFGEYQQGLKAEFYQGAPSQAWVVPGDGNTDYNPDFGEFNTGNWSKFSATFDARRPAHTSNTTGSDRISLGFGGVNDQTALFGGLGWTQRTQYLARMSGLLSIATAGDYSFFTESDDGSVMFIDHDRDPRTPMIPVVDNNQFQGMGTVRGGITNPNVYLETGDYEVMIGFFQGTGSHGLNVRYSGPGIGQQNISNSVVFTPGNAPASIAGQNDVDLGGFAVLDMRGAASGTAYQFGHLTLAAGSEVVAQGRDRTVRFASTALPGSAATLSFSGDGNVGLGAISGGLGTLNKDSAGTVSWNGQLSPQTINLRGGELAGELSLGGGAVVTKTGTGVGRIAGPIVSTGTNAINAQEGTLAIANPTATVGNLTGTTVTVSPGAVLAAEQKGDNGVNPLHNATISLQGGTLKPTATDLRDGLSMSWFTGAKGTAGVELHAPTGVNHYARTDANTMIYTGSIDFGNAPAFQAATGGRMTAGDNFQFLWTGYLNVTATTTFSFDSSRNDDDVAIYIDVNRDGFQLTDQRLYSRNAVANERGHIELTPGLYPFAIAHNENTGGETLTARINRGGGLMIIQPSSPAQAGLFLTETPVNGNFASTTVLLDASSAIDLRGIAEASFGALKLTTPGTTLTATGNPVMNSKIGFSATEFLAGGTYTIDGNASVGLGRIDDKGNSVLLSVLTSGAVAFDHNTSQNFASNVSIQVAPGARVTAVAGQFDPIGGASLTLGDGAAFRIRSDAGGASALQGAVTFLGNGLIEHDGAFSNTLAGVVTLSGTLRVDTLDGTLTLGGSIVGADTITKQGKGTLRLGAAVNQGQIFVNGGTLGLNASNLIGDNLPVTVNNGGTFAINGFSEKIGVLRVNNAGAVTIGSGSLSADRIDLTGGTVRVGSGGTLNMPVGGINYLAGASVPARILSGGTGALNLDTAPAGANFHVPDGGAMYDLTVGAKITGSAPFNKTGAGMLYLTNPANDFTSPINYTGGLAVRNDGALGLNPNITVPAGGTFRIVGDANISANRVITIPNSGKVNIDGQWANAYWHQAGRINANILGTADVVKSGFGVVELAGTGQFNSFDVQQGIVRIFNKDAVGAGPVTVRSGGVFELNVVGRDMSNIVTAGYTSTHGPGHGPYHSSWEWYGGRIRLNTDVASSTDPSVMWPTAPITGILDIAANQNGHNADAINSRDTLRMGAGGIVMGRGQTVNINFNIANDVVFYHGGGTTNFTGLIGGSGDLIVRGGDSNMTFRNTISHTGYTAIDFRADRAVFFQDDAKLTNSTDVRLFLGRFLPDDSQINLAESRFAPGTVIKGYNGELRYKGKDGQYADETIPRFEVWGNPLIASEKVGTSDQSISHLFITDLARIGGGQVNFFNVNGGGLGVGAADPRIYIGNGASTLHATNVTPWALVNNRDWAIYDAATGVRAFSGYVAMPAGGVTTANVAVDAAVTVNSATTINSIKLNNNTSGGRNLTLNAPLTITSGGILAPDSNATSGGNWTITGSGGLSTAGKELVVYTGPRDMTINTAIQAFGMAKTGNGNLILQNAGNSFGGGNIHINGGRVDVLGFGSLGNSGDIFLSGANAGGGTGDGLRFLANGTSSEMEPIMWGNNIRVLNNSVLRVKNQSTNDHRTHQFGTLVVDEGRRLDMRNENSHLFKFASTTFSDGAYLNLDASTRDSSRNLNFKHDFGPVAMNGRVWLNHWNGLARMGQLSGTNVELTKTGAAWLMFDEAAASGFRTDIQHYWGTVALDADGAIGANSTVNMQGLAHLRFGAQQSGANMPTVTMSPFTAISGQVGWDTGVYGTKIMLPSRDAIIAENLSVKPTVAQRGVGVDWLGVDNHDASSGRWIDPSSEIYQGFAFGFHDAGRDFNGNLEVASGNMRIYMTAGRTLKPNSSSLVQEFNTPTGIIDVFGPGNFGIGSNGGNGPRGNWHTINRIGDIGTQNNDIMQIQDSSGSALRDGKVVNVWEGRLRIYDSTLALQAGAVVNMRTNSTLNLENVSPSRGTFNIDADAMVYHRGADNRLSNGATFNFADGAGIVLSRRAAAGFQTAGANLPMNVNYIIDRDSNDDARMLGPGVPLGDGMRITSAWNRNSRIGGEDENASFYAAPGATRILATAAHYDTTVRQLQVRAPLNLPAGVTLQIGDQGTFVTVDGDGNMTRREVGQGGEVRFNRNVNVAGEVVVANGRLHINDGRAEANFTTPKITVEGIRPGQWGDGIEIVNGLTNIGLIDMKAYGSRLFFNDVEGNTTRGLGKLEGNGIAGNIIFRDGARTDMNIDQLANNEWRNIYQKFTFEGDRNVGANHSRMWVNQDGGSGGTRANIWNIHLAEGATFAGDENNGAQMRTGFVLEGNAKNYINYDQVDLLDIRSSDPNVRRTLEQGTVGGTIRTTDVFGRIYDNAHVQLVSSHLRMEPGSDLQGTGMISATGQAGGAGFFGNVDVRAGKTGSGGLSGGTIRLGGSRSAIVRVDEVAAAPALTNTLGSMVEVLAGTSGVLVADRDVTVTDGLAGTARISNVTLNAGSNLYLQSNNNARLAMQTVTLAGNAQLTNNSSSTNISAANVVGGAHDVTFGGLNATRVTGNVAAANVIADQGGVAFDAGAGLTNLVNAPVTLKGNMAVLSGTTDMGSNMIVAPAAQAVAGLTETLLNGAFNTGAFIQASKVVLDPRMAQQVDTGGNYNRPTADGVMWADNRTFAYVGQIYIPDNGEVGDGMGSVSFAANVDDGTLLVVDGQTLINNNTWNTVDTSGVFTRPAGWYSFELRVGNGQVGAGPSGQAGWPNTKGFGWSTADEPATDTDHAGYAMPIDPGDGSLFRTAINDGPKALSIAAGGKLMAGGFTGLKSVTLNGEAATLRLNDNAALVNSSTDVLAVAGAGASGLVDLGANNNVAVQTLNIADDAKLEIKQPASGRVSVANAANLGLNAELKLTGGKTTINAITGGTLNVGAATVAQIASASSVNQLVLDATAKVDVAGASLGIAAGDIATVNALVASGRSGGDWDGVGINSSVLAEDALKAYKTLATLPEGDGVRVKYTWAGDLTGDGRVGGADYMKMDLAYLQAKAENNFSGKLYHQGDLDYNGVLNGDDYFLIDTAYLNQNAVLSPGGVGAAASAAVPEPSTLGMLAVGALGLLARRRRNKA